MRNTIYADKTIRLFTRYLRKAGLTVSYSHIRKLLDTPVGLTMRGFSDALDVMQADHRVYQLPTSCLEDLDAPFLTQLRSGEEYVMVEKITPGTVTYRNHEGLQVVDIERFRDGWTGVVLVVQSSEETFHERYVWWKDILYSLRSSRFLWIVSVCWILLLLITHPSSDTVFWVHLLLSGAGSTLALQAILHEQNDPAAENRFCRIGSRIDCRRVLHSGVKLAGTPYSLGEVAWWGFTMLAVFACSFPQEYLWISMGLLSVAFLFTLYSVFYQAFVIRSWCLICMGINLVVWVDLSWLLWQPKDIFSFSFFTFSCLGGIGICVFLLGLAMRSVYLRLRKTTILQHRLFGLLEPSVFAYLLSMQPRKELPDPVCTISSPAKERCTPILVVILSPRCRHCAEISKELRKLTGQFSLQLVFLTASPDSEGKEWVQKIIALYLSQGWEAALTQVEKWYKELHNFVSLPQPEDTAIRVWTAQQQYCRSISLDHTPTILVNGYELPDYYEVKDLHYIT